MNKDKLINISNEITSLYPHTMTLQPQPNREIVETLFHKRLEIMNDPNLSQRYKIILFNINWGILNNE